MAKFTALLHAGSFLLLVLIVWLAFLVITPYGWYQVFLVVLCLLVTGTVKVLGFIVVSDRSRVNRLLFWLKAGSFRLRRYTFSLWVSNDQYINKLLFGHEDHTISGRVGYLAYQGNAAAILAEKVIDGLFYFCFGQARHCYLSIEWCEVKPCQA